VGVLEVDWFLVLICAVIWASFADTHRLNPKPDFGHQCHDMKGEEVGSHRRAGILPRCSRPGQRGGSP